MRYFERIVYCLSRWLNWVAGGSLVVMMLLVCANVFLRLLHRPILGTYEIVGFLGGTLISFGLAYTTVKQGHIAVELVVSRLPNRIQGIIISTVSLLSILLFAIISWRSVCYAINLAQSGEMSQTLRIPFFPLLYGLGFACALVCLVLLIELFKSMAQIVMR